MKVGEAVCLVIAEMEMLKNDDFNLINWMLRIFSVCMEMEVVPED